MGSDATLAKEYDVVVVGSGAGGLAAAVSAAHHGLSVLVVEKSHLIGGATAWSGGWAWAPRNFLAVQAGIHEGIDAPKTYLKHELGEHYQEDKIDAFLQTAPEMARFFHEHTALQFEDGNLIADIHGDSPGAGAGGRSIIARPVNASVAGPWLKYLRPPMPETALWGMPIQAGTDLKFFLNARRDKKAFWYVTRRISRHTFDKMVHRRTMQLRNGSALVARLAQSAQALGVALSVSTAATELIKTNNAITGIVLEALTGRKTIAVRLGVVLATGGFAHDVHRREQTFPPGLGRNHFPLPPQEVAGDGLRMAEAAGAALSQDVVSAAAWCPVSLVPYPDGRVGHFPHIIDRAKPGVLAVLPNGKRFVNEANGYYDVVSAMIQAMPDSPFAWLICDHATQRRYGLGMSRPAPFALNFWLKSGYLQKGATLEELAKRCDIDSGCLKATVDTFNRHAACGQDPEFGRGQTLYNQKMGDASHQPNASLGVLGDGPYYAVKMRPGSFGTFYGIQTNAQAQVLDTTGAPIAGLYAAGVDMESIFKGFYPTGGVNLGPALTFGYMIGRDLSERATKPFRQP